MSEHVDFNYDDPFTCCADARRYRWLREHFFTAMFHTNVTYPKEVMKMIKLELNPEPTLADEDSIDAAIDAAMEEYDE